MSISPEHKPKVDIPDTMQFTDEERALARRVQAADKEAKGGHRVRNTIIIGTAGLLLAGGGVAAGNYLSNSRADKAPVDEPSTNPDAQNGGITTDPTTGESSITITTPPSSAETSAAPSGVEIAATREASIKLLAELNTTTTPEMNQYMMTHPITQAEFPTAKDAAPALFAYLNAYENGGVSQQGTLIEQTSASKKQGKELLPVFFAGVTPDMSISEYPALASQLQKNRDSVSNMRKYSTVNNLEYNVHYPLEAAAFKYVDKNTTHIVVLNVEYTSNAQENGIGPDQMEDRYYADETWYAEVDPDTGIYKLAQDPTWSPDRPSN